MDATFKKIKSQNTERFAKALRDRNLLTIPGIEKITEHAGNDPNPILDYLNSLKNITIEEHSVHEDPIKLLRKAGYIAFHADTLEKQNSIKEYYAEGEAICTFDDEERYKDYHIIHCLKSNINDIKREDFKNPDKFDEYNLSLISIQIKKDGEHYFTIGRYNHKVKAPNETLPLDAIAPGLAYSCKMTFNVDFSSKKASLPENYMLIDNQIVRYSNEVNGLSFDENYYVNNSGINKINKNEELILDYFILDLKNKKVIDIADSGDSFPSVFEKEIEGKKIQIVKNEKGNKCLLADGDQLLEIKDGKIIGLRLKETKEIPPKFLMFDNTIEDIILDNTVKIGDRFLWSNECANTLDIPKTKNIGDYVMQSNLYLKNFFGPEVETVGMGLLLDNKYAESFITPNLKNLGYGCLSNNGAKGKLEQLHYGDAGLKHFYAPVLEHCEGGLLDRNETVEIYDSPLKTDDVLCKHPKRENLLKIEKKISPQDFASLISNSTGKGV